MPSTRLSCRIQPVRTHATYSEPCPPIFISSLNVKFVCSSPKLFLFGSVVVVLPFQLNVISLLGRILPSTGITGLGRETQSHTRRHMVGGHCPGAVVAGRFAHGAIHSRGLIVTCFISPFEDLSVEYSKGENK